MTLRQTIDLALAAQIGGPGIPETAIEAALSAIETALVRLREDETSGRLPLLTLPQREDDLPAVEEAAGFLRNGATDVVFLGTGGSSLGGQTLAQLADYGVPGLGRFADKPRVHFLDNLDPRTFERFLAVLPLESTRFAAVSKSGGTGETLMQTIAVLSSLGKAGLSASDHVVGLSEERRNGGANALRDLLEPENVRFLVHDPKIGGRYSVLTNVGLLPAAVLGLDIRAIRRGARGAYEPIARGEAKPADIPAALGASLAVAAELEGKASTILFAYGDGFERLTRWWVQLWAESLGKDGKGTQPVAAIGPVDQHSQLQLYLGGRNDKLFTVLTLATAGTGPVMDAELARRAGLPDFAGRTIGDLVAAQGRATADTLARNKRPVRQIAIAALDEATLGELLMHFMLETILTGYAMGVDPFDQPAVEEGKILAKKYLAEK